MRFFLPILIPGTAHFFKFTRLSRVRPQGSLLRILRSRRSEQQQTCPQHALLIAPTARSRSSKKETPMIRKSEIERFSLVSSNPFDQVVAALDASIGHPDMAEFRGSTQKARSFV